MFKITTFKSFATDADQDRIGVHTSAGLVSGTNLFTNALPGDRVILQHGAGRSWGTSPWVMVGLMAGAGAGPVEAESEAEVLAAALVKSTFYWDALRCAQGYDYGALVFIVNAVEGVTKARLLGLVSDVAALLRRDSQWVL
jgi:hypothetical protein